MLDAASHEFKTPLTSMKAAASALQLAVRDTDPRRELVEIVNADLVRLQQRIGGLAPDMQVTIVADRSNQRPIK